MACLKYEEKINLLVDGELTEKEEVRVKEHVEACPACKGYYDTLLLMRGAFDEIGEEEAPEGFASSVMEGVRAAGKPKRQLSFRFPFTAAAAVIVVVLYAFNGQIFNAPKSADMVAKEKSTDNAAAESARGYGVAKSAEQPTLSVGQSQNDNNLVYSKVIPETPQTNGSETKDSTETTAGSAAGTEPAPEAEGKGTTAPAATSGKVFETAPDNINKYAVSSSLDAAYTLKSAVDIATIQKLGKVRFAYLVTPKKSMKEKLTVYASFAQAGGYTYYKLTADEWNAISGEAESTSAIDGISPEDTAEFGVIVVAAG